ncbi:MAG: XisI protein [Hormoscilla sp. SP5CHS1]|nr:XisI protein [Hormoscilla sp. SP5CHS1]
MEGLNYQEIIENILNGFSNTILLPGTELEIIRDRENGHYLVMLVGWKEKKRVYSSLVHFDIKEDRIWIQQNGTDTSMVQELTDAGVPRDKIVIGLDPPLIREKTEYFSALITKSDPIGQQGDRLHCKKILS